MQYYLLKDRWFRFSISNVIEALTIFRTVLSEDHDVVGRIAINGELSLGIRFRDDKASVGDIDRDEELRKWKAQWTEASSLEVTNSAQYDRARLDELVMPDIGIDGNDHKAGYLLWVGISRGVQQPSSYFYR